MFDKLHKKQPNEIEKLIKDVTTQMEIIGVDDDDYPALLAYLERLTKLKVGDTPKRVDRNTIALIAGNLAGILLIVAYEQKHVMTTKAFGWVKPRADY